MNPASSSCGESWRRTPALFITVTIIAIGVLAGLLRALMIAPLHVPFDPNEGWNAYHALAAITTGNPYPPPGSFIVNNYPPLSFYLVGLFGSLAGDNVVAGRFVSLAAFALICAFSAISLRWLNVSVSSSAFAVLFFAGTLLLTSDYVGMNDPQLMGHAFQLAGLLFVLRRPRADVYMAAAAALFVAGGFIKHNLFALPLACVIWLAVYDRRNAIRLLAGLLAIAVGSLVAVKATLGVDLFQQLNSPREFSLEQLERDLLDWLTAAGVPLCALLWLLFHSARDEIAALVGLYATVSIFSGALLLGGAGVDVNVMFDSDIALALSAGLVISRLAASDRLIGCAAAQIVALLCILPLAVIVLRIPDWRDSSFWLSPMHDDAALAKRDILFLSENVGAAMCQNLTFCYWAGKKASVDVFNLNQQFATGTRDAAPFLRLLRAHDFASVELDETVPSPFPRNVESVFFRNYRIDHQDDEGIFFVPRQPLVRRPH